MKFCKLDYTILEDNILHLCSELNFVDIKTLKFPMCDEFLIRVVSEASVGFAESKLSEIGNASHS